MIRLLSALALTLAVVATLVGVFRQPGGASDRLVVQMTAEEKIAARGGGNCYNPVMSNCPANYLCSGRPCPFSLVAGGWVCFDFSNAYLQSRPNYVSGVTSNDPSGSLTVTPQNIVCGVNFSCDLYCTYDPNTQTDYCTFPGNNFVNDNRNNQLLQGDCGPGDIGMKQPKRSHAAFAVNGVGLNPF